MWGGHVLPDYPRYPSQNPIKRVNYPIRTRWRTSLSYWYGNESSRIMNSNIERISTPGLSSTSSSSSIQFSPSRSSNVDLTACFPSRPVAPNGENRRHTQAANLGVIWGKIIQGSAPSIHQLSQHYTFRDHPAPVWWSWENTTHRHWRKWTKN